MPTNAPPAAKPSKSIFDPFNSSATGHQRADNRLSGSTSWRDSRSLKLREQFSAGAGGGKRVSDIVGAGSLDFGQDGRTENGGWVKGASGLRTDGQKSIWESMGGVSKEPAEERPTKRVKTEEAGDAKPTSVVNPWTPFKRGDGAIRPSSWTSHESSPSALLLSPIAPFDTTVEEPPKVKPGEPTTSSTPDPPPPITPPQIFRNCTIYINGSTHPTISDHKLKHLISTHGGRLSIALGRRTVTHVIVGKHASAGGSGGGLAGSKIQKEVMRKGGCAVRFVTVEWVVESVRAGKRLSEVGFEGVRTAPRGVGSIVGMFGGKKAEARKGSA